jgi:hypothetical protein
MVALKLDTWITVRIYSGPNGTGKLLKWSRFKARSFLKNFIDLLYTQMAQSSLAGVVDTGGVSRTVSPTISVSTGGAYTVPFLSLAAAAGDDTRGIQVGTSTIAVAIDQFSLQGKIAHGVGSGQLQYGAMSVGTPATVGNKRQFTAARTFTNNSGADITVNEVGLVSRDIAGNLFLIERTVLPTPKVIPNGGSSTWTYTISVTAV